VELGGDAGGQQSRRVVDELLADLERAAVQLGQRAGVAVEVLGRRAAGRGDVALRRRPIRSRGRRVRPRSVRAVTSVFVITLDPPAETATDSGYTCPKDVEGCE
jgi:hypothetical protein